MDLMNLLRSIEALLYELVSWLVFYPVTVWRCLRHPHQMMAYAEKQLSEPTEAQFQDAVSGRRRALACRHHGKAAVRRSLAL